MLEPETVQLLHVEDDDLCLMGLNRAFKAAKIANPVRFAHDGIEALEMLRGTNGRPRLPRPFLVLLDLNMPRMDGREVLGKIKEDPNLKNIPVVVLTTSADEEDIVRSYNLHANCYVTKPVDLQQFMKVVSSIEDFWFTVVKLPGRREENL